MSFSSEVKTEIASHFSGKTAAQLAAMAAILVCIGKIIPENDGTASLFVNPDNTAAATKFFTLLEKTTNINFKFVSPVQEGRGGSRLLPVAVHSWKVRELAQELDLPTGKEDPKDDVIVPWVLLSDDRCIRAYLRSMFLCTGMISNPAREYRCEFVLAGPCQARQLKTLLDERGIAVRQAVRRRNAVIYSNSAETIGDLLTLMEARNSFLQFQNARLEREVRGSVNRQVNCETANIKRTVTASARQQEDIRILEESGRLGTLSPSLQEIARVRRENPDVSLQELGALLDPPVGRSGVNHRLRKLHEAAQAESSAK